MCLTVLGLLSRPCHTGLSEFLLRRRLLPMPPAGTQQQMLWQCQLRVAQKHILHNVLLCTTSFPPHGIYRADTNINALRKCQPSSYVLVLQVIQTSLYSIWSVFLKSAQIHSKFPEHYIIEINIPANGSLSWNDITFPIIQAEVMLKVTDALAG